MLGRRTGQDEPKIIKKILEGAAPCRRHGMTPKKSILGRDWPMAGDKEMTPAVQREIRLYSFGVSYEDDMSPALLR